MTKWKISEKTRKETAYKFRKIDKAKISVRYTTFHTPVGIYFIAATDKGICKLHWPASEELLRYVERYFNCILVRDDGYFEDIKKQIISYLEGDLREFKCKIDFLCGTDFQKRVWKAMMNIPYGETRSYQWIAKQVGSPKGFRAAGQASHNNPVPIIVPCHRVIGKDGSMVGYGGPSKEGQKRKRELLEMEGAL